MHCIGDSYISHKCMYLPNQGTRIYSSSSFYFLENSNSFLQVIIPSDFMNRMIMYMYYVLGLKTGFENKA